MKRSWNSVARRRIKVKSGDGCRHRACACSMLFSQFGLSGLSANLGLATGLLCYADARTRLRKRGDSFALRVISLCSKKCPVGATDSSNQGQFEQEWVASRYARQACDDGKVDRDSHGRYKLTRQGFGFANPLKPAVFHYLLLLLGHCCRWLVVFNRAERRRLRAIHY